MQISAGALERKLSSELPSVILAFGDEPLLVEETCDRVRARAADLGYGERLVMTVESKSDWSQLIETSNSMSLFSARRLIDLRLPGGKPGDAGTRALVGFCGSPPPDTALLIVCGRLDSRSRQSKWFKAVDRAGVTVEHKSIDPGQLPGWIKSRLQARGKHIEPDALEMLAFYLEGNLLAAAQEIDKLALLCAGQETIRGADVERGITDSARFDVYTFIDHCTAGNAAGALRSLGGLKRAGVEPALIVWALANQVRTLYRLAAAIEAGRSRTDVFQAFRVWSKKTPAVNAALNRFRRPGWARLLQQAARLDRVLKGREAANIWYALEQTSLAMCGVGGADLRARLG